MTTNEIPTESNVLNYWKTFEFFNFFDLDSELEGSSHQEKIECNTGDTLPWQKVSEQERNETQYTICIGITPLSALIETLQKNSGMEADEEYVAKNAGKRTCLAKFTLCEELGTCRIESFGVSTLHWAVTRFLGRKALSYSDFRSYQDKLLTCFNEKIIPYLAKTKIDSCTKPIIDQIFRRCLYGDPSAPPGENVEPLWFPDTDECPIVITKFPKSKVSHFAKLLKREFPKLEKEKRDAVVSEFQSFLETQCKHETHAIDPVARRLWELTGEKDGGLKSSLEIVSRLEKDVFNIKRFDILNSFFMQDLERCDVRLIQRKSSGLVKTYLSQQNSPFDLLSPDAKPHILETVRPRNLPLARWPDNPAHTMSLMQQYSIIKTLRMKQGEIFSVNGPPGTGKTTLLKEIIANVIANRAEILASLKNPEDGFTKERFEINGYMFHGLIPDLKNHSMVVASSNNTGVENISKELPSFSSIFPRYHTDIRYLAPLNDAVNENAETWGLISAALGKGSNINRFVSALSDIKKQAPCSEGSRQSVTKNPLSQWLTTKTPGVPDFSDARAQFLQLKEQILVKIRRIDKAFDNIQTLQELTATQKSLGHLDLEGFIHTSHEKIGELKRDRDRLAVLLHANPAPGVLFHLFKPKAARERQHRVDQLLSEYQHLSTLLKDEEKTLQDLTTKSVKAKAVDEKIAELEREIANLDPELQEKFTSLNLDLDDHALQLCTPLVTEELNEIRNRLFLAALTLHESWLESIKGKYLRTLCYQFRKILTNPEIKSSPGGAEIFQHIFLLCPVISTTFSSVSNFLGPMKPGTFGWSFFDESGQATPQSAVGMLMRSDRCVAVGDPLQIEPIRNLPDLIYTNINQEFSSKMDIAPWNPCTHSVQTLADRVHPYQAKLSSETSIGCPLRVHRRCANPMFSLSNEIAYHNKMILGRNPNSGSSIESAWYQVRGPASGAKRHWVIEQGKVALHLCETALKDIHWQDGVPSLFVISPFREVIGHFQLFAKHNMAVKLPHKWYNDCIGTIHTFQGKEADVVILLLGLETSAGPAHKIVGNKPNLLNVALTRAKKSFLVVGDQSIWKDVSSFDTLADALPLRVLQTQAGNPRPPKMKPSILLHL